MSFAARRIAETEIIPGLVDDMNVNAVAGDFDRAYKYRYLIHRVRFAAFWLDMFTVKTERGTSRDGFSLNKNHRSVKRARGKK